jgi:ankyrin repeat protein
MLDFSSLFKLRSDLIESISTNDTKRLYMLLGEDRSDEESGATSTSSNLFVNLNFIDHDGQTLMHRVCRQGNLDILKLLVKHGASQNLKNKDGWFPIHLATYFGHYELVKFLINENNFQHQSLIAVYDDDVTYNRVHLNCAQYNRNREEAGDNEDETSTSGSDSLTDSDITDDDEDDDEDDNNESNNENGDNLDDLINNIDLKYLELNDSNEKILEELMLNASDLDVSLSFLPNSNQIKSKTNKFLSIF